MRMTVRVSPQTKTNTPKTQRACVRIREPCFWRFFPASRCAFPLSSNLRQENEWRCPPCSRLSPSLIGLKPLYTLCAGQASKRLASAFGLRHRQVLRLRYTATHLTSLSALRKPPLSHRSPPPAWASQPGSRKDDAHERPHHPAAEKIQSTSHSAKSRC